MKNQMNRAKMTINQKNLIQIVIFSFHIFKQDPLILEIILLLISRKFIYLRHFNSIQCTEWYRWKKWALILNHLH